MLSIAAASLPSNERLLQTLTRAPFTHAVALLALTTMTLDFPGAQARLLTLQCQQWQELQGKQGMGNHQQCPHVSRWQCRSRGTGPRAPALPRCPRCDRHL